VNLLGLLGTISRDLGPDPEGVDKLIGRLSRYIHRLTGLSLEDIVWTIDRMSDNGTLDGHPPGSLLEAYAGRRRDLSHVAPRLHELDRDGTTEKVWRWLYKNCQYVREPYDAAKGRKRGALAEAASGGEAPPPVEKGTAESAVPRYVTLDQMAVIIHMSKRTVEKWKKRKKNPLPAPDVEGTGGKAARWLWSDIRPWLEKESGYKLPDRYPSLNPLDARADRN
jgi:hypothetical protein